MQKMTNRLFTNNQLLESKSKAFRIGFHQKIAQNKQPGFGETVNESMFERLLDGFSINSGDLSKPRIDNLERRFIVKGFWD